MVKRFECCGALVLQVLDNQGGAMALSDSPGTERALLARAQRKGSITRSVCTIYIPNFVLFLGVQQYGTPTDTPQ